MSRLSYVAILAFCLTLAGGITYAEASKTTLVLGQTLEPPHLDPTAGAAAAIDEIVYANLFEGLTRIDENGAVQPALAQSWTISEDGLTYVFKLHTGVTFHDGAVFDASDVKFSLDRARAEGSLNAQKKFVFGAIDTVAVLDSSHVEVKLVHKEGLFLWKMGWGDAIIVDPASAESNKMHPTGTGPLLFTKWVKGDRIILEQNADYWGKAIALKKAVFRIIPDPVAQVSALLAGDVDVIPVISSPELLPQFKQDARFQVLEGTTEGETILVMNQRRDLFKDQQVRVAITHAIDRATVIAGAMSGVGTPIGTHFAPHHPAYLDLTGLYPYDVERARALLKQAGVKEGTELEMKLPPTAYARRSGEIIAAELAKVGLNVKIIHVEWAQWLSDVFKGEHKFDFTIISHTEPLDIGIYGNEDYYFGYKSEPFNTVMEKLATQSDKDKRYKLYGDAQRIIAKDAANVYLFQLARTGVAKAGLKGLWKNAPIQAMDLTNVSW